MLCYQSNSVKRLQMFGSRLQPGMVMLVRSILAVTLPLERGATPKRVDGGDEPSAPATAGSLEAYMALPLSSSTTHACSIIQRQLTPTSETRAKRGQASRPWPS
jgi:hypothetical protein